MEMFNWLRGGSGAHVYYCSKATKHVPWRQRPPCFYWWKIYGHEVVSQAVATSDSVTMETSRVQKVLRRGQMV